MIMGFGMNWNSVVAAVGAAALLVLGGCSGPRLPPQQTVLSYPGGDPAAQSRAAAACSAYGQNAVPLGPQTASDGSKLVTFKCQ